MNPTMPIPPEIKAYLETILQEAGVAENERTEEKLHDLFLRLDTYLAEILVSNLNPTDLEVFIQMNKEKRTKEELEQFIKEKLPNAQSLLSNSFGEFKR